MRGAKRDIFIKANRTCHGFIRAVEAVGML